MRRFYPEVSGTLTQVRRVSLLLALLLFLAPGARADVTVERLTTTVPFPRGLSLADPDGDGREMLYVLSRGRVRGAGGADPRLDDRAGTIWEVDPATGESTVFAEPTDPPFRLLDRSVTPASADRRTDRPYCVLRWHEASRSFYLCAFSGVDLPADSADPAAAESGYFSKNYTDAVLRYDVDQRRWHEVDRHDPRSLDRYPGDDGRGWAKGPDNLAVVDDLLVVAAKDNSRLIAYDLGGDAGPRVLLGDAVTLVNRGGERRRVLGHSALAYRDGWLYVGFRTTGEVVRLPLEDGEADAARAELLAQFEPWDPATGRSANVTDLDLGPDGDVYVVSAQPARVFRFAPDPANPADFTGGRAAWADLAAITGNPRMKSENVLVAGDGTVYVTSGDAYAGSQGPGLGGTVWRVRP